MPGMTVPVEDILASEISLRESVQACCLSVETKVTVDVVIKMAVNLLNVVVIKKKTAN